MNEKIKSFFINHSLLCAIIAAAICAGIYFFAGSRVHDNGVGVDTVRHEIGAAISQQQQISRGLQDAESTAGTVAGSIERSETASRAAASTADSIEATIEQQRSDIEECRRIIERIRQRGQKAAANN